MLRFAMVSGWHAHAKGYARAIQALDNACITVVYDEDPARGQEWADELGVPFESDYAAILQRDDVDAICCDAPTNLHPELMIAAAEAGKHIFTEKVLALTVKECNAIADAVNKADVRFGISYPYRCQPVNLFAKKVAEEGLIGDVTFMRTRVAHNAGSADWLPEDFWNPASAGGGAMMDLGAHPMYLQRWIMGQPCAIGSTFTYMTGHEVEDNSVCTIEYISGAIGVAETGFMSSHSPFWLELSGTEGNLTIGGPDDTVRIQSNKLGGEVNGVITPAELPDALPSALEQFVTGVTENSPILFDLEQATQLTELMEYAYIAHREKRQVEIPKR
jgi:predicted dehydrogenase